MKVIGFIEIYIITSVSLLKDKLQTIIDDAIELLKYDQILKDEQISKLKSENESLNLFLSKNDPKSYFEIKAENY